MCSELTRTGKCATKNGRLSGAYLPLRPPGPLDVFWSEIASTEHVLQVYERDEIRLDAMEGFAAAGLRAGEAIVVIATPQHALELQQRLERHPPHGFNLDSLKRQNRYIVLDAAETMAAFCDADGWPDETKFVPLIRDILDRAGSAKDGERTRSVRAFGEMVAMLWIKGQHEQAAKLEQMWHALCETEQFALFCAYPKIKFTRETVNAIRSICANHSKVIPG